jgi:hypothetical protein
MVVGAEDTEESKHGPSRATAELDLQLQLLIYLIPPRPDTTIRVFHFKPFVTTQLGWVFTQPPERMPFSRSSNRHQTGSGHPLRVPQRGRALSRAS